MAEYARRPGVPAVAVNDVGDFYDFLTLVDTISEYFKAGDIIRGTIVKVDRHGVLVDVGGKSDAFISCQEFSNLRRRKWGRSVAVGDEVEIVVLTAEDEHGTLIASKKRADADRAWAWLAKTNEEGGAVSGKVIEVVAGGLIVDLGARALLPASLIEMQRVHDLHSYLGKEIEAEIIELDRKHNRLVLSRRALLERTRVQSRATLIDRLCRGELRQGVVSSIVSFGAFVDLGGVDGLVHVSELSWRHIDHPSEVVEVGQEVTVEVLEVDLDRERVSLSLKATQEDPWRTFVRTHAVGQVVPGKVTKLVPFGAFVRVQDGIEGLVHISELAVRHVELAEQVVSVDDELLVEVIDIDLERRRISLSLKQANEAVDADSTEFDPALYGMAAERDEEGNYKYPEGFDPESNEWLEGYETQRAAWERQYADAQARWEAHKKQVSQHAADDANAGEGESDSGTTSYSSEPAATESSAGTLASNEALIQLRKKLAGE
ncbi:30S ribosomal protein S1 [Arthrobacter sp. KN11-1C]|uniref:30S ribosomal protein S1 n=1 Tax=Arthrobacter sp. KN11-1C TaxID=3445774 RepID=UPI003F9ECE35